MKIRSLIAVAFTALPFVVRAQGEAPRLVVSFLIDQLRTDYMEAFMPLYGDGGFRRLLTEGRVYNQAQYPFARPDRASATACLYSGCSPYENGVVGERWINRNTLRPVFSADDDTCTGIQTTDGSSPRQCGVSTITDELKVATEGKAMVCAIAPFRDAAVFSAGHAADAAVWIDDATGMWCTSSYYGGLPAWASSMNTYRPLAEQVKQEWVPVNDLVGNFNYFMSRGTREPFKHKFSGAERYRDFKTSGLVNDVVGSMTMSCVNTSGIGLDAVTDFLAVSFYAGNYRHMSATSLPMEQQDIYVRLDYTLAYLMTEIEKKVGRGRVLFVLTSTGYADEEVPELERYRIPTGTFSMVRAASLLNMYLGAVYGQERWVETQFGRQIFLDHKLVENKGINMTEMLERCSDFLVQMNGVEDVYTSPRLALGAWTPGIKSLRNSINPKFSGDIILDVAPGWHIENEDFGESHYERESYMGFPLIFLGENVGKGVFDTPVELDCVAPTLAKSMRIRAPNACKAAPLSVNGKL